LELLQLPGKTKLMAHHVVQDCFVRGVTGAITHPKQETTAKTGLKDLRKILGQSCSKLKSKMKVWTDGPRQCRKT